MLVPPIYVFVNHPRKGRSWITDRLADHLGWNEGLLLLGPQGDRQRNRQGVPDPSVWTKGRLRRIRVITGEVTPSSHLAVGSEGRYLAFLQDPAGLLADNYQKIPGSDREQVSFRDWCSTRINSPQTRRLKRFFGLDNTKAVMRALDDFWFVGVTEHIGDDLPRILETIDESSEPGIPPAHTPASDPGTGKIREPGSPSGGLRAALPTDELRDRIYADNPADLELYRYALQRRTQISQRYGWA